MPKYKIAWDVEDTLEAEDEEEARTAFMEMLRDGVYGPLAWELEVKEVE